MKCDTLFERLKQWRTLFHMFYIEPVFMVLIFAVNLSDTVLKHQIIYQACDTVFHFNQSICEKLGTRYQNEQTQIVEKEVQQFVTDLLSVKVVIESIVPAVAGLFIGSWTDHYGRKPMLLFSMSGYCISSAIMVIISAVSLYVAVNPWYYIAAAVPHAMLGGNGVFTSSANCFLTDVTDMKMRPYRMIIIDAVYNIALMSSSLLSSFIYEATNTTTVFSISGTLLLFGFIFLVVYVPETLRYKTEMEKQPQKETTRKSNDLNDIERQNSNTKTIENLRNITLIYSEKSKIDTIEKRDNKENSNLKTIGDLKDITLTYPDKVMKTSSSTKDSQEETERFDLFDLSHVREMFHTCIKARECYNRSIIWLIMTIFFINSFSNDGCNTVDYLFTRAKFNWTIEAFNIYDTVSNLVTLAGALVGFLVMRKLLNVSVISMVLLSLFSKVVSNLVRGFATEPWHFYLGVGVGVFKSICITLCRTIVSNVVPSTDLAKIFTLKNVFQSFATLTSSPFFAMVYKKSLKSFPGLYNVVGGLLYIIPIILMIVVLIFKYKHKKYYAKILK